MRKRIIIIVLLLVGVSFIFSRQSSSPASQQTKEQVPNQRDVLLALAQTVEVKPEFQKALYWSWVDAQNNVLPLTGEEFFIGSSNTRGIAQYKAVENSNIENVTLEFLQPLIKTSNTFYTQQRFTKNVLNTMETPDEYGAVSLAYELGELKCLVHLYTGTDPFGRFFCGIIDKKQLELQQGFEPIFPMKATPGQQPPLLRIEKIVDNFALGNYAEGAGPGGYTFMAKKTDGTWAVVWKGQEIAQCSEMEKYQIPKSIYGECYKNP